MGYTLEKPKFHYNFPQDRRVHITEGELDITPLNQSSKEAFSSEIIVPESTQDTEDQMLLEVFQVLKKRQQVPPPGGYMFSKNNHVTTKMGCPLLPVLYSAPPIPAGIHRNPQEWDWNPQEWDWNPQESTRMGPVKSSIPATVLVEYGRTWNPVGILHLIDVGTVTEASDYVVAW